MDLRDHCVNKPTLRHRFQSRRSKWFVPAVALLGLTSGALYIAGCGGSDVQTGIPFGAEIFVKVEGASGSSGTGRVVNVTQVSGGTFLIDCSIESGVPAGVGCDDSFIDANGTGAMVLSAVPETGHVLVGWGGNCTETAGSNCTLGFSAPAGGDVNLRAVVNFSPQTSTTVSVTPGAATLTTPGETVQLAGSLADQQGGAMDAGSLLWTSSSDAVATVSGSGGSATVTAVGAGSATITASVPGGPSGSATVTVEQQVADVGITTSSLSGGTVGMAYSQTLVATGGDGTFEWTIVAGSLPAGLALDPATGEIAGTPSTSGTTTFTVQAASAGKSGSATLAIAVNQDLRITTEALPNGTVGVAYSEIVLAAGGDGSFGWSIEAGSVSAGLTFNPADGRITGTPTTAGVSTFTLQVVSAGDTATAPFTITIQDPGVPLSIVTAALPDGRVAASYSLLLEASGGAGNYRWALAAGTLPHGIALNPTLGRVSGVPVQAGVFPVTIEVSSGGDTVSVALTLTVANGSTLVYFEPMDVDTLWTAVLRSSSGGVTSVETHPGTGGFDAAFRQIQHVFPGAGTINVFHRWEGVVYEPEWRGEITSISFSDYHKQISPVGTGAVGGAFALEQDGVIYAVAAGAWSENAWTLFEAKDLTAADFAPAPGPDFSPSGGPIQFGFIRSNTRGTASALTVIHGTDNFKVEVHR